MENQEKELQYPMELKTREDYEFIRNNFPREMYGPDFIELMAVSGTQTVVGIARYNRRAKEDEFPYEWEAVTGRRQEFLQKALNKHPEKVETITITPVEGLEIVLIPDINQTVVTKIDYKDDCKMKRLGYTEKDIMNIVYGIDPEEIEKELEKYEREAGNDNYDGDTIDAAGTTITEDDQSDDTGRTGEELANNDPGTEAGSMAVPESGSGVCDEALQ